VFAPILDALLRHGDHYLHLADLKSYSDAHARLGELYSDQEAWSRKAILNIAASGEFSSDRTIAEYARTFGSPNPAPLINQTPTPGRPGLAAAAPRYPTALRREIQ